MKSKLSIFSLFFLIQTALGAETATLEGWPSGTFDVDCPFTYEMEPNLYWDKSDDPPLTLRELNLVFEEFSEIHYPDKDVTIGGYQLMYNNFFLGGDVGWIYFINFGIREPGSRSFDGYDGTIGRALVTMTGKVIEVDCNQ